MSTRTPIPRLDALKSLDTTIVAASVPGMRTRDPGRMGHDSHFGTSTYAWDRGWAVSCDLTVDLNNAVVSVSWSAMSRTPAEARAAVVLYSAVADLACLLESQLRRMTIAGSEA